MSFSSLSFIFWFLPVFFICYFVCPRQYRNMVLLVGSLFFYACGKPILLLCIAASVLINYFMGNMIISCHMREAEGEHGAHNERRVYLLLALVFDLGMLFVFRYLGFFFEILHRASGSESVPELTFPLPLGISIFTLHAISFIVDIYRQKSPLDSTDSLVEVAVYLCMFPLLPAGPIVKYRDVAQTIRTRKVDVSAIERGACLFVLGLSYKVLLADQLGHLWDDVQTVGPYGINALTAWIGSIGFSMQVYLDLFGLSMMAMGLGMILGFQFPENFDDPYCSDTATEFWKRFNMTLSNWFKTYLYLPMGGSKQGKGLELGAFLLVILLMGVWYGAGWNLLIWILLFVIVLVVERVFLAKILKAHHVISKVYMIILMPVSWTIFHISDLTLLGAYLKRMFLLPVQGTVAGQGVAAVGQLMSSHGLVLLIGILCCTPIPIRLYRHYKDHPVCKVVLFVLFWIAAYRLTVEGFGTLPYFKF